MKPTTEPKYPLNVVIDQKTKETIIRMAEERGMKLTEIGRRALKQYLEQEGYPIPEDK